MIRSWEIYPGRKNSMMMKVFPMWDDASYYWTWNKKWLRGFLENRLITNLEYMAGIKFLKELKDNNSSTSR